jgi:hypothetical protein
VVDSTAVWIVGVALALSGVQARAAAPSERLASPQAGQPTDSDVAAEVLRVEVAPAIDDAALLPTWIADRHPGLDRALRSPEGGPAQWIVVRIDGTTYDYRVSVTAMRGGDPVGPIAEPARCECTTEELLELVDAGIEAVRGRLHARVPSEPAGEPLPGSGPASKLERAQAVEAVSAPEPTPRGPSSERLTVDAPSRRLGLLGRAGIGVGVAGAGLMTAGILLAKRPREIRGEPGNAEVRDLRGGGVGLATSGGIVLATGVVMLVADLVVPLERSIVLVPLLRPRMAGVSLVRRF